MGNIFLHFIRKLDIAVKMEFWGELAQNSLLRNGSLVKQYFVSTYRLCQTTLIHCLANCFFFAIIIDLTYDENICSKCQVFECLNILWNPP